MNAVPSLSVSTIFGAMLIATSAFAQTMVSVPPFNGVELEGGGHVIVRYGSEQQVRLLNGSTQFTHFTVDDGGKLRIEACNSDCPHQYNLEVEITTPRIAALAISGGGRIEGEDGFPSPAKIALAVEGGGAIDARALDAVRATAAVDGGGDIRLRADRELTAAIHGGGKIRYWGNPHVVQAIDGGGAIERGE
jgi:hypothetical protein